MILASRLPCWQSHRLIRVAFFLTLKTLYVEFIWSAIFTSYFYPSNLLLMWSIGHFHRFLRIRKWRFPKIRKSQLRHHWLPEVRCLDKGKGRQKTFKTFLFKVVFPFFAKLSGPILCNGCFNFWHRFELSIGLLRNGKVGFCLELDEGGSVPGWKIEQALNRW